MRILVVVFGVPHQQRISNWTLMLLYFLINIALVLVLVSSDIIFDFLWVVVAKVALFRGLLHINAARKLAVGHSMWWQQFFLRYFLASTLPIRSRCTSLSAEFPRRSLWVIEYTFNLCFVYSRRHSSSDHHS